MRRSFGVLVAFAGLTLGLASPVAAETGGDVLKTAAEQAVRGCDPIDPAGCLVPFPNDWFTARDGGTDTGRRVALKPGAMPRNILGKGIDPAEFNRSDGFSPGSPILLQVPGLDVARSGLAPSTDIGRSLRADAPVVLIDAASGRRQPYWTELDAQDPKRRTLIIRPAVRLGEAARYLVAVRGLRGAGGAAIKAGPVFAALSKTAPPSDPRLKARWAALQTTLRDLRAAGIGTQGLNLAWDFTTASARGLTGRAVAMRDTAFKRLGAKAPKVRLTSVKDFTAEQDPRIARRIKGLIEVPSFINATGTSLTYAKAEPGPYDPPVAPTWRTYHAPFQCNVPRSALKAPARPVLFGHGLFGGHDVVDVDPVMSLAGEHGLMPCATDWMGLSGVDRPYLALLTDLSNFKVIPDRMQQSYINALYLGRWMIHQKGAQANRAFRLPGGAPAIDTKAKLTYSGISLGGIQGAALTALGQDFTTSALSVPGINFSTLLQRSALFKPVSSVVDIPYPDKAEQQVGFALVQMLWDRGEGNGYAGHLVRDPLPGSPDHRVLLHEAFGDDAVANITTETMARSLGIPVKQPAFQPGRGGAVTPLWGIPGLTAFPYTGSAMVMWDAGTPVPPADNRPPQLETSPHGATTRDARARAQVAHYLKSGGQVVDVCGGGPCVIGAR